MTIKHVLLAKVPYLIACLLTSTWLFYGRGSQISQRAAATIVARNVIDIRVQQIECMLQELEHSLANHRLASIEVDDAVVNILEEIPCVDVVSVCTNLIVRASQDFKPMLFRYLPTAYAKKACTDGGRCVQELLQEAIQKPLPAFGVRTDESIKQWLSNKRSIQSCLWDFKIISNVGRNSVTSVRWSPTGGFCALQLSDGSLVIRDEKRMDDTIASLSSVQAKNIDNIMFSSNGQLVALQQQDDTVSLYRVTDLEHSMLSTVDSNPITRVEFSYADDLVFLWTGDHVVIRKVADLSRNELTTINGKSIKSVEICSRGTAIALQLQDDSWTIRHSTNIQHEVWHSDTVEWLRLSPDGSHIAFCLPNGSIEVRCLDKPASVIARLPSVNEQGKEKIIDVSFSFDNRFLALKYAGSHSMDRRVIHILRDHWIISGVKDIAKDLLKDINGHSIEWVCFFPNNMVALAYDLAYVQQNVSASAAAPGPVSHSSERHLAWALVSTDNPSVDLTDFLPCPSQKTDKYTVQRVSFNSQGDRMFAKVFDVSHFDYVGNFKAICPEISVRQLLVAAICEELAKTDAGKSVLVHLGGQLLEWFHAADQQNCRLVRNVTKFVEQLLQQRVQEIPARAAALAPRLASPPAEAAGLALVRDISSISDSHVLRAQLAQLDPQGILRMCALEHFAHMCPHAQLVFNCLPIAQASQAIKDQGIAFRGLLTQSPSAWLERVGAPDELQVRQWLSHERDLQYCFPSFTRLTFIPERSLTGVEFSPNDAFVVFRLADHRCLLINTATLARTVEVIPQINGEMITAVRFSQESSLVAIQLANGFWIIRDGGAIHQNVLEIIDGKRITNVYFSPNKKFFVVQLGDQSWEIRSLENPHQVHKRMVQCNGRPIQDLVLSPNNEAMGLKLADREWVLTEFENPEHNPVLKVDDNWCIHNIFFSPNGEFVVLKAFGLFCNSICYLRRTNAIHRNTLTLVDGRYIDNVKFNSDGRFVALHVIGGWFFGNSHWVIRGIHDLERDVFSTNGSHDRDILLYLGTPSHSFMCGDEKQLVTFGQISVGNEDAQLIVCSGEVPTCVVDHPCVVSDGEGNWSDASLSTIEPDPSHTPFYIHRLVNSKISDTQLSTIAGRTIHGALLCPHDNILALHYDSTRGPLMLRGGYNLEHDVVQIEKINGQAIIDVHFSHNGQSIVELEDHSILFCSFDKTMSETNSRQLAVVATCEELTKTVQGRALLATMADEILSWIRQGRQEGNAFVYAVPEPLRIYVQKLLGRRVSGEQPSSCVVM